MQGRQVARGHEASPLSVDGRSAAYRGEWSTVTYNTLSCNNERLQHILRELRSNQFVGLQGTNCSAGTADPPVTQAKIRKYLVFDIDFPARPCSLPPTKGAGVTVATHRAAFNFSNVVRIFVPPDSFSGRLGTVRVKRKDADFCIISAYIPVEPRTAACRKRVLKLWRYIHWIVEQLPSRCVPILLCDANGRVGSVQSSRLGHANLQRENFNGSQLRARVDSQPLRAVNTFYQVGHTWPGPPGTTSRIDYVVLLASLQVHTCRAL